MGKTSVWSAIAAHAAIALYLCGNSAEAAEVATADPSPVTICDLSPLNLGASAAKPGTSPSGPSDLAGDPLNKAASSIEAMLNDEPDQISAADRSIAFAQSAAGQNDAKAPQSSAGAIAAFCAAAGEAYRLGRGGSPFQAKKLLTGAYRLAALAHREDVSALAAYRLGLLNLGGYATGARGLRRAALRSPTPPEDLRQEAGDGCLLMDRRGNAAPSAAFVSVSALGCAISGARAAGAYDIGARASVRLARYWLDHGRRTPGELVASREKAAAIALDALDGARRVTNPVLRFDLMGRLADAAIDSGAAADDPRLQSMARTMAEAATDNVQQSQAAALRARLALASGQGEAARGLLRQAIFLESQNSLPLRLPDWFLLLAQADPARRSEHLTAAFRALNSIRPLLPRFDATTAESNFTLRAQPVFEALLADRLTSGGANPDDPVRIGEAQALVEEYRQAELQSVFGSECVAGRPPIRPSELRKHEVLLYPVLLPDRVVLIYAQGGVGASGEAPRYHLLPANLLFGRSDVIGLVNKMADSVSYGSDNSWRAPARQLYDILIAPIADKLGPEGTLVVIPDGPLSTLPFAALLDAKGQFLIEQTNLATVPSLAYSQPGVGLRPADTGVVAASLEKAVNLSFGNFPALTGTSDEARFAVAGRKHGQFIENFHRADLVRALAARQTDVLHLATHASFNGRSDRSYIVADGEHIPIADLRNLIARNQTRGEQLDLLVLSACETAVGDDQASLGLAGAAVQSGARSVLASLWQVNDVGTAQLMKGFYTGLGEGKSKAAALRASQLALIRQGDELADPSVWAAFIMLGGWR